MIASQEQLRTLSGIIYKFTNKINNKVYIGETLNTFIERYHKNWWNSAVYRNSRFQKAINRYGHKNFIIEILMNNLSLDALNVWEDFYIKLFRSADERFGYNIKTNPIKNPFTLNIFNARGRKNRMSKEAFIKRAKKIHGNKYNYSNVEMGLCKQNVKIFCKKCQCYFEQRKDTHLDGFGHSACCFLRPVIKLDKNTLKAIATFPSITEAARAIYKERTSVGLVNKGTADTIRKHIGEVCKGKEPSASGFKWKYAD
jgi:group I intron endonuclease